jgi:tRNA1(Val) A37 N6-methylase TrmN6
MVTLSLCAHDATVRVVAIEHDAVMADFLARNVAANGFAERVTVVVADIETAARGRRGSADLVVANPPFWSRDASSEASHPRADAARRDDDAPGAFLRAARNLLGRGGRACFVWPASDLEPFLARAASQGLHAKRARFVHPMPGRDAHRVLVELKPGRAGGLRVEPALTLMDEPGVPSAESHAVTRGETSGR